MINKAARPVLSLDQRKGILARSIINYAKSGFRVTFQTDTTASLVRPKTFSCLWACLWTIFFGVGLIFYLIYYWSKHDDTAYMSVDEYGQVKVGM